MAYFLSRLFEFISEFSPPDFLLTSRITSLWLSALHHYSYSHFNIASGLIYDFFSSSLNEWPFRSDYFDIYMLIIYTIFNRYMLKSQLI